MTKIMTKQKPSDFSIGVEAIFNSESYLEPELSIKVVTPADSFILFLGFFLFVCFGPPPVGTQGKFAMILFLRW